MSMVLFFLEYSSGEDNKNTYGCQDSLCTGCSCHLNFGGTAVNNLSVGDTSSLLLCHALSAIN